MEKLIYKFNAYRFMFVRKKKFVRGRKSVSYYYLEKQVKVGGNFKTKTVRYLGTAEKILQNYNKLTELKKKEKTI